MLLNGSCGQYRLCIKRNLLLRFGAKHLLLNGSCGQYRLCIKRNLLLRFGAKHLSTLPANTTRAQHQISTCSTSRVCWELRSASLVLLNTAGDDYKPTRTRCQLNVWPDFFQISYITLHTIYSTEQKKTRQYARGLAKLKQKIWIELTTTTHPPIHFFLYSLYNDNSKFY